VKGRRRTYIVGIRLPNSMFIIYYFHYNIKTWNEYFKNIFREILICPLCKSEGSLVNFSFVPVQHVDIGISKGWDFADWVSGKVFLYWITIYLPILKCMACGVKIKIKPSFLIDGTVLTLPALQFVAFAYEYSITSWRKLTKALCIKDAHIAHSTLYKAVHGLGMTLELKDEAENLARVYCPHLLEPEGQLDQWPPEKSVRDHTVSRERQVRNLLTSMLKLVKESQVFIYNFLKSFIDLTKKMSRIRLVVTNLYRRL